MEFTPCSDATAAVAGRREPGLRGRRRSPVVNVVSNAPCATVKTLVEAYFEAWKDEDGGAPPLVGMQRHVVVADTDAEALSSARDAYRRWYESLTQLWRQFGTVPVSFADSLEGAIQRDAAIVGSPATVRAEVQRQLEATGANYFVGRFLFGWARCAPAIALTIEEAR